MTCPLERSSLKRLVGARAKTEMSYYWVNFYLFCFSKWWWCWLAWPIGNSFYNFFWSCRVQTHSALNFVVAWLRQRLKIKNFIYLGIFYFEIFSSFSMSLCAACPVHLKKYHKMLILDLEAAIMVTCENCTYFEALWNFRVQIRYLYCSLPHVGNKLSVF